MNATAPSDELKEEIAKQMRADYIERYKPNTRSWDEIDEGMRETWRIHADSVLIVIRRLSPSPDAPRSGKSAIVLRAELADELAKLFGEKDGAVEFLRSDEPLNPFYKTLIDFTRKGADNRYFGAVQSFAHRTGALAGEDVLAWIAKFPPPDANAMRKRIDWLESLFAFEDDEGLKTAPNDPVTKDSVIMPREYYEARVKLSSAMRKALEDWQPIETAPRDGTHILIAFGEDVVASACYTANDDETHPWKFVDQQGKGLPIFNGARDDKYGPTHWMPLPSAPHTTQQPESNGR